MQAQEIPYEKQILVCVNDREGVKPSCGDHQGPAVFTELRRLAKERGWHPRVRVAQAKCLGKCSQGVTVMVYPDHVWYSDVRLEDVETLADQYLPSEKNE